MKKIFNQYLSILDYKNMPEFLKKYLELSSLKRLKNICYFCGMDYASKEIYNFQEKISRYDHSLSVALLTWKFTKDKCATLSSLFHDISTPCFSHVIDYMNKDYSNQESTEAYTEDILKKDNKLIEYLKIDNILLDDIIDFKKYSIVDNNRPKMCTDRLDGVILTSLYWTKNLNIENVKRIIDNIKIYTNEDNELELGFKSKKIAELVIDINKLIDLYCHSNEDNYMMELLANITRLAIEKNIIKYEDLYILDENKIMNIFENSKDIEILNLLKHLKEVRKEDIPETIISGIKIRNLKPLVNGKRDFI